MSVWIQTTQRLPFRCFPSIFVEKFKPLKIEHFLIFPCWEFFKILFLKRSFTGGLNNAAKNKNVSLVAMLYPFFFAGPPFHRIHPIFDVDKREGYLLYFFACFKLESMLSLFAKIKKEFF